MSLLEWDREDQTTIFALDGDAYYSVRTDEVYGYAVLYAEAPGWVEETAYPTVREAKKAAEDYAYQAICQAEREYFEMRARRDTPALFAACEIVDLCDEIPF